MIIHEVQPKRVRVTSRGRARVRVTGHGYGVLCCGLERRMVFGAFDESFSFTPSDVPLEIHAHGLGPRARARVDCVSALDISPPLATRTKLPVLPGVCLSSRPPRVPPVTDVTGTWLAVTAARIHSAQGASSADRGTTDDDTREQT